MNNGQVMRKDHQVQFTTRQAANRHGIAVSTLRRWRREGIGPKFRRITGSLVLYDLEALDAFFKDGDELQSTAEG